MRFPTISRRVGVLAHHFARTAKSVGEFAHPTWIALAVLFPTFSLAAPPPAPPGATVTLAKTGRLTYTTDPTGDRIPDFSYAGYAEGSDPIPTAPIRVVVPPGPRDSTAEIQKALDYVASLPLDPQGLRGAVLLQPGRYEIAGGLIIRASGVVLRGSGAGPDGTLLLATGHDRRTLITIAGTEDRKLHYPTPIADTYVPVGSFTLHVKNGDFKPGQTILIERPTTPEWIKALGMNDLGGGLGIGWKPGTRNITWDRTITAASAGTLTLDAPITSSLDAKFGGGTIAAYTWPGRISRAGVENLRCESAFDPANPKDEAHSWFAITLTNAQDAWVRQVTASHFVASTVAAWDSCKCVTVLDCRSLNPVSEIAGQRRRAFFTAGQLTLFQDCWSENGLHDFSVGCCAAGPNAFVQCTALHALGPSGPVDSWANGLLFDNVQIDGSDVDFGNLSFHDQFAGWSAANCVLWQCQAATIICDRPPTAQNWAYACWGQYAGGGYFSRSNETVRPFSLYYQQLAERTGDGAARQSDLLVESTDANSSPTAAKAAELIAGSTQPAPLLSDWIDRAGQRHPIPIDAGGAVSIDALPNPTPAPASPPKLLTLQSGLLLRGNCLAVGLRPEVPWWLGGIRLSDVAADRDKPAITRFVPGRYGPGLTDDLEQLANNLLANHLVGLEQHYGLWYDRRSDDHERTRRSDGDAWPPFYELPFARSGQGTAWDGLSKYDLTKYNPWYFDRLQQFAALCDQNGLVLIHQQFFQHNIIEDGAHWATCPWRSANNINNTGFPEPPPYVGDKRIFMAEQFYDTTNSVRTAIYRAYIRHCLDNFAGEHNVIQLTAAEFTGPLHFMQWWLDTVAEWEHDTGRHAIIGLSATKDVQDAILADPVRSKIVDIIDIRYWWYQQDGKPYAPLGGQNLSPRQHERVLPHKPSTVETAYRAVAEYRQKFPDKAVIYSAPDEGNVGWGVLMAGGSLPWISAPLDPGLLSELSHMHPVPAPPGEWTLADPGRAYLIYFTNRHAGSSSLPPESNGMIQHWIEGSAENTKAILWLTRP